MKAKSIIPAGAALVIAFSTLFAVPASAKSLASSVRPTYSMANALARAKQLLAIPSDFTLTQESFDNNMQQGEPSYSFSFSYTTPDNQGSYINVTMGATTGNVLSYARNSAATGFVYPLPVSAGKAQELAVAWAKKLYPQQLPYTRLQPLITDQGPLTAPVTYTYNFTRYVQGIAAPFDGISLTIDQNGRLIGASDNWTEAIFPGASGLLSPAKAAAVYSASLGLYLGYSTIWNSAGAASYALSYQPPNTSYPTYWNTPFGGASSVGTPVIEASNGQLISSAGTAVQAPAYVQPQPIVKGGPAVFPGTRKVDLTQAQALRYARYALALPATDHVQDVSDSQTLPTGDVMYNFTFKTADGHQITASVDATTGALTSFYGSLPPLVLHEGSKIQKALGGKVTQAQIDATVKAFIKRAFAKDTGGLAIAQSAFFRPTSAKQALTTNFSLEPLVHGLPVLSSSGQIAVSGKTGQLVSFWGGFGTFTGELPSPEGVLTPSVATADWVKSQPLTLTYLLTQPVDVGASSRVVLTYAPAANPYGAGALNALTGGFLESGVNPAPYTGPIQDLNGVAAAPQIALLVAHGLLPVTASGEVHPQAVMTRAAFVKLVVDSLVTPGIYSGPALSASAAASLGVPANSPDFSALQTAFSRGWINQGKLFHPNAPITRGDAAQILARALGYAGVLAHPAIFTLPAKDASTISPDQLGGDAIAYALGMFPLMDGNFAASSHVTVAQAAVADVQLVTAYSEGSQLFLSGSGD